MADSGSLNVTSSPTTTSVTGGGGINPGDKVTLVISATDPPVGALIQLHVDTSLVLDSPEPESPESEGGGGGGDGGSLVPGNAGTGGAGTGVSGVAPNPTSPFYFAWVNSTDSTWTSDFARWDINIFDFVIEHTESNFPMLTITVPNPFVGFLNPGRLYWAWFAWQDPTTSIVYPLFFGRLVGVPTDLVNQTVQMKLIARPTNYIQIKQQVAESLKVFPYYDPDIRSVRQTRRPRRYPRGLVFSFTTSTARYPSRNRVRHPHRRGPDNQLLAAESVPFMIWSRSASDQLTILIA